MNHNKFYASSIQVLFKFYTSSTQLLSRSARMVGYPHVVVYGRDSVFLNAKNTGVDSGPVSLACEVGVTKIHSVQRPPLGSHRGGNLAWPRDAQWPKWTRESTRTGQKHFTRAQINGKVLLFRWILTRTGRRRRFCTPGSKKIVSGEQKLDPGEQQNIQKWKLVEKSSNGFASLRLSCWLNVLWTGKGYVFVHVVHRHVCGVKALSYDHLANGCF